MTTSVHGATPVPAAEVRVYREVAEHLQRMPPSSVTALRVRRGADGTPAWEVVRAPPR